MERHHSTPRILLAAALTAGAAQVAAAADITWTTGPTFNGPNGHLGILTNGTLVEAINLAGVAGSNLTVDPGGLGIVFQTVNHGAFGNNFASAGGAGNSDAAWASILNTFEWQSGANVSDLDFLTALVAGHAYQVQFFAARTDCCGTRTATFGDGAGHLSAAIRHDSYTSVVGSFVADGAVQAIDFIDSTGNPILNAYVLRDMTPVVPEPGTLALTLAGLAALAGIGRRHRR